MPPLLVNFSVNFSTQMFPAHTSIVIQAPNTSEVKSLVINVLGGIFLPEIGLKHTSHITGIFFSRPHLLFEGSSYQEWRGPKEEDPVRYLGGTQKRKEMKKKQFSTLQNKRSPQTKILTPE